MRLVDCPGLVMPNLVPLETQVRPSHSHLSYELSIDATTGPHRYPPDLARIGSAIMHPPRRATAAPREAVRAHTPRATAPASRIRQAHLARTAARCPRRYGHRPQPPNRARLDHDRPADRVCAEAWLDDGEDGVARYPQGRQRQCVNSNFRPLSH